MVVVGVSKEDSRNIVILQCEFFKVRNGHFTPRELLMEGD